MQFAIEMQPFLQRQFNLFDHKNLNVAFASKDVQANIAIVADQKQIDH